MITKNKKYTLEVSPMQIRMICKALRMLEDDIWENPQSTLPNFDKIAKTKIVTETENFINENIEPVIYKINRHLH